MKEISPILLLIISVILIILLTGFGLVHLICKTIYQTFQVKFWKGPIYFVNQILKTLYQIWNCIKYLCIELAISFDLFGNVVCGEAIEDVVTSEENTLYGKGDVTISSATGDLELKNKLNKTGVKFTKILSKTLGEKHCVESYKKDEYIRNFKL